MITAEQILEIYDRANLTPVVGTFFRQDDPDTTPAVCAVGALLADLGLLSELSIGQLERRYGASAAVIYGIERGFDQPEGEIPCGCKSRHRKLCLENQHGFTIGKHVRQGLAERGWEFPGQGGIQVGRRRDPDLVVAAQPSVAQISIETVSI